MLNSTLFRMTAAVLIFGALSACETVPVTEGPNATARPVSAEQLLSSAATSTPDGRVELLDARNRGFILNTNNTITYVDLRSRGELLRETAVTTNAGNRICMERLDPWSGACLTLFQNFDGTVTMEYKFGNGFSGIITSSPFSR